MRAAFLALMVPLVLTLAMPRVFVSQSESSLSTLKSLTAIRGKIESLAASGSFANSDVVRRDLDRLYAVTDQGTGLTGIVGFASGILGGVCLALMYMNSLRGREQARRSNLASVLIIVCIVATNFLAIRYAGVEAATTLAQSTKRLDKVMGQVQLAAIAERDESLATQLLLFTGPLSETNAEGETALHLAAERGMTKLAAEIVRRKQLDIDAKDSTGATPLMCAITSAHPEIASLLIKGGADVNTRDDQDRAPLHLAADARRTDIAAMLLDAGAEIDARDGAGRTPLSVAYAQSDHELFAALIERGAQVSASEEGARLAHDATAEAIKAIERSRDGDDQAGAPEMGRLRQILAQGADPNAVIPGAGTPLHRVASAVESLPESSQRALLLGRVAGILLDAGADPDAQGDMGKPAYDITLAARFGHAQRVESFCTAQSDALTRRGLYGKTALVIAVEGGQNDVARVLIRHGAKMNAWIGAGRGPIETAVLNGSDDLVTLMLDSGFSQPNDSSAFGGPLHLAAKEGRLALLQPLLGAGYDICAKDSRGNTPLLLACEAGQETFAIALVENGADPLTWNNAGETALSLSEKGDNKSLHAYLKRATVRAPKS